MKSNLVPDTPGPMMGDGFELFRLHFLHGIVKEEVNKDCVDVSFWALAENLTP